MSQWHKLVKRDGRKRKEENTRFALRGGTSRDPESFETNPSDGNLPNSHCLWCKAQ